MSSIRIDHAADASYCTSPRAGAAANRLFPKENVVMQRIITLVALCAICQAPVQSHGDDQPDKPATLARQILQDKKHQVFVNVRMIEVSSTRMREAGLNFPELARPVSQGDQDPSSDGHSHVSGLLGIANPDNPLFALLDDLQKKGLAKTASEPTLVAVSGCEAYFASGGQVPILNQRVNGKLTTEFAKFGSEIMLTPAVLDGGRIQLNVKSRFAELDKSLEASIGGRIVPGLKVRECQASADLASGDTMVLGGMPNNVVEYSNRDGGVFAQVVEKELLVLVTPRLTDAQPAEEAKSEANRTSRVAPDSSATTK
jgi:Flp pilus assembly secretin CpaC